MDGWSRMKLELHMRRLFERCFSINKRLAWVVFWRQGGLRLLRFVGCAAIKHNRHLGCTHPIRSIPRPFLATVCHQATARLDRSPAPSGTPTVKQCLLSKNIQPLVPLGIKIAICLSKWLWSHTLVVVGGRDFTSSWFQSTCHLHIGSLPT